MCWKAASARSGQRRIRAKRPAEQVSEVRSPVTVQGADCQSSPSTVRSGSIHRLEIRPRRRRRLGSSRRVDPGRSPRPPSRLNDLAQARLHFEASGLQDLEPVLHFPLRVVAHVRAEISQKTDARPLGEQAQHFEGLIKGLMVSVEQHFSASNLDLPSTVAPGERSRSPDEQSGSSPCKAMIRRRANPTSAGRRRRDARARPRAAEPRLPSERGRQAPCPSAR